MMFSEDDIMKMVKNDFDRPGDMAEETIEEIEEFDEELKSDFEDWFKNGVIPDRIIQGFSIPVLVKEYKMNIIGAFLTMDWLSKEPEAAIEALNYGYDSIV